MQAQQTEFLTDTSASDVVLFHSQQRDQSEEGPESKQQPEKAVINAWQTSLIKACENRNLAAVKQALQDGADPCKPDPKGNYALPAAIWGMDKEVIAHLKRLPGIAALDWDWDTCVAHNKWHYGSTFYVPDEYERCIPWLESKRLKPSDTHLSSIGISMREITESRVMKEQKEVVACRSICCTPVHYDGEAPGYSRMSDHSCNWESWVIYTPGLGCAYALCICCVGFLSYISCNSVCGGLSDAEYHMLSHALCCVLPECCSTTATVSTIVKNDVVIAKQVQFPVVAAQTLFGEMVAIRRMQEQQQRQSLSLVSGPMQMQMW